MKIGGVYILTVRNIERLIAVIAAAFAMICTSPAARADIVLANRCANAAQSLLSLKCSLAATSATRAVVPDIVYRENKSLYLMLKPSVAATRRAPPAVTLSGGTRSCASAPATKSDLRTAIHAAVKTILRGEDVNAAKPGPRVTAAKRRQIEAAEAYRKSHAGCTLHNACIKSFVAAKGGYKSAKTLYRVIVRL